MTPVASSRETIPSAARFWCTTAPPSVTDIVHSKNHGFRNALAWLDGIVRQLSDDAIPVGPVRNRRLVLDSRPAKLEEVG